MYLLPVGLLVLLFLSLLQAAWSRRRAFELRMQILEVAALATRVAQPVVPAIRKLALEHRGRDQRAVTRLARELESGEELSEALRWTVPCSFPPRVLAALREADGTPQLAEVLQSQVEQSGESLAVQHRIAMALLYPLCLALGVLFTQEVVIALYSALPAVPVPDVTAGWFSLRDLFGSLSRPSHPWLVFAAGVLLTILAAHRAWRRFPGLRRAVVNGLAVVGWTAGAGRELAGSRFLHTLSHLVAAGQALPAAMRRALGAAGNPRLERGVLAAAVAIEAGHPAIDAWRLSGLPEFAVASLTVTADRRSDELAAVLRRTAAACRERYVARRERLLDLLHPIGILVAGVLLAWNFGVLMSLHGYLREATGLW